MMIHIPVANFAQQSLPIKCRVLNFSSDNVIDIILQMKQIGKSIIRNTIKHQIAKYIFPFKMFCDKTQRLLLSCGLPPAPTVGMEQLTSVGNVLHIGLTNP